MISGITYVTRSIDAGGRFVEELSAKVVQIIQFSFSKLLLNHRQLVTYSKRYGIVEHYLQEVYINQF